MGQISFEVAYEIELAAHSSSGNSKWKSIGIGCRPLQAVVIVGQSKVEALCTSVMGGGGGGGGGFALHYNTC